ncbi:MAG TPA: MBL fold metallo-hydrolase [Patescibacteria group bacterium]|nr:MBL fold metallo-hydrolase [Patescibacteria group bacterium]
MKAVLVIGFFCLLTTLILFTLQHRSLHDGVLHLVFCDVGQGDAIFVKTPEGKQILIDGGPDEAVLSCLSEHMPFWDHTLDLVVLTHPHADHFLGLISVLERYTVLSFAIENISNNTAEYRLLEKLLQDQKISTKKLLSGNYFQTADGVKLTVLSPTNVYLKQTSPNGLIGEKEEFASLILHLAFGSFSAILTGDTQYRQLSEAITAVGSVSVLQIPHHGSRSGLTTEILSVLLPKLGVISVGKNRYGHPAPLTTDLLDKHKVKTLLTKEAGDIEIIATKESWRVQCSIGC